MRNDQRNKNSLCLYENKNKTRYIRIHNVSTLLILGSFSSACEIIHMTDNNNDSRYQSTYQLENILLKIFNYTPASKFEQKKK